MVEKKVHLIKANKTLCLVIGSILAISVGINIFLLVRSSISISHVYNRQHYHNNSRGQFVVSVYGIQGELGWKCYTQKDLKDKGFYEGNRGATSTAITRFLNSLRPESALLSKIIVVGNKTYIFVPEVIEDMEKYDNTKVWKQLR